MNFPKHTGIREATLLLVREKSSRYTVMREPLFLDRCIVSTEAEWEDYFEVHEISSKETFIFKASTPARNVAHVAYAMRIDDDAMCRGYRLTTMSNDILYFLPSNYAQAEDGERTKQWYTQLQYHAQGMGAWRKRRNALANIMINGMMRS